MSFIMCFSQQLKDDHEGSTDTLQVQIHKSTLGSALTRYYIIFQVKLEDTKEQNPPKTNPSPQRVPALSSITGNQCSLPRAASCLPVFPTGLEYYISARGNVFQSHDRMCLDWRERCLRFNTG